MGQPLKRSDGRLTCVQVSTVFGADPDYWTLAMRGSDQHQMIDDYEIVALAEPPKTNLYVLRPSSGVAVGL